MRLLVCCTCLVALAFLADCTSGVNRPPQEVTAQEVTAETDAKVVQKVTIDVHSYYFEPNRIIVKAGVPVEITTKNHSFFVPHNMSCIAPQAGIQLDKGLGWFHNTRHIRFIPTQPGEYPFFCKVDGHSKKGMTGTLIVR